MIRQARILAIGDVFRKNFGLGVPRYGMGNMRIKASKKLARTGNEVRSFYGATATAHLI